MQKILSDYFSEHAMLAASLIWENFLVSIRTKTKSHMWSIVQ